MYYLSSVHIFSDSWFVPPTRILHFPLKIILIQINKTLFLEKIIITVTSPLYDNMDNDSIPFQPHGFDVIDLMLLINNIGN